MTVAGHLARQARANTHPIPSDMPDLLLEFLSEEIPARMQARAAEDLRKLVTDRLVAEGLTYEGARRSRRQGGLPLQFMAFRQSSRT